MEYHLLFLSFTMSNCLFSIFVASYFIPCCILFLLFVWWNSHYLISHTHHTTQRNKDSIVSTVIWQLAGWSINRALIHRRHKRFHSLPRCPTSSVDHPTFCVSKKQSCKGTKPATVLHLVPKLIRMNGATLPCLNGIHKHKFTFTHTHTCMQGIFVTV